jgi:hypothetical protein
VQEHPSPLTRIQEEEGMELDKSPSHYSWRVVDWWRDGVCVD